MFTLAGHLHPVLVHLPIGILLIALALEFLSIAPARSAWKPAADLALGLGVLSAAFSCITGYLLSLTGGYDQGLVTAHQWMAISLTVLSGLLFFTLRGRRMGAVSGSLSVAVLLLVFLTGHWGGTLTHGSGYLSLVSDEPLTPVLKPVPNIQTANVYTSLVQPVLHDNCYRCHSAGRQKGGLRLDSPDAIARGGKDGPGPQELLKRIQLPLDDEHHMAPKDKTQLTKAEVALLQWWVAAGAPFDKRVADLPQDSTIKPVLAAFERGTAGPLAGDKDGPLNVADSDMPQAPVHPASAAAIERLRTSGALVLPIAEGSPYLDVRFPNDSIGPDALRAIDALSDQVVTLKLSNLPVGDDALATIGHCKALVRLWLDHTRITGRTLGELRNCAQLRYLNLAGTAVSDVTPLQALPHLQTLYLFQTRVDRGQWAALQKAFPHTRLDSGGYAVPFITTDTQVVRAPVRP
jgi:uncharacterized membrane protein